MAGIPQIKVIFDRRKKASAVNPGTVEIEVSYNRERVRLSTGVAVLKQQWSGREVVNHPEADRLNEQIRRVYDGLHEKMATIASKKGEYDLSLLKKVKKTKVQGSSGSFLDWLEERIYMRPVTESTRRQHLVMLKCLREFGLIRFFCDLTPKNIRLWDDFIRKRVTAQSSVHGYHKRLKPYIIEAIQFEKLETNPYEGMRISRGKSEGIKFLTEEERDRVEALELYGMTEKVRDMFIFSCYTGLAYSDLVKIKKSDMFMQGDDYCIRDKRMKTGMPYTIVLLPKAIAILRKYDYNLNLMSKYEQPEVQRPAQTDSEHGKAAHQPDNARRKTLYMVFIVEFEWVAKIGFLIGNDLETSEVLYSALLNPKNADFKCKGSELVWIIIILVL